MSMQAVGSWSGLKAERGSLKEYTEGKNPLTLEFEFNPTTITRTRSVTIKTGGAPGSRGGYDFANAKEAVRAAQGVSVSAESFSIKILLDATDRMNAGNTGASTHGIQPELDVIRTMLEPRTQKPEGAATLDALGQGERRGFSRHLVPAVLLFKWGGQVLPVFLTKVQIEVKEYLPTLVPYRAEVTLDLQIIESRNPFYDAELKRQTEGAGRGTGLAASSAGG